MAARELNRLRKIVLDLPDVCERVAHGGALCFLVQGKTLCYYHDNYRGEGRASLWCRALVGMQQELVDAYPKRFFKPQTSSSGAFRGWLGVFLDGPGVKWKEVATVVTDAYRTVAPKPLIATLDDEN